MTALNELMLKSAVGSTWCIPHHMLLVMMGLQLSGTEGLLNMHTCSGGDVCRRTGK